MTILDFIMLGAVAALILWIGYRSTKKTDSAGQYMLAGRSLGRIQAGFSLAASDIGGSSIVGATALVYAVGIAGSFWNLTAVPAFFVLGFLITKRLRQMEITTVNEFMGQKYGPLVRFYTSVLHLIGLTLMFTAQLTVSGSALQAILGIPQTLGFFISLIIVLVYTAGGGLLAVVNTDVVQFVIVGASVVLVMVISLVQVGGPATLASSLPSGFLDFGALGFWEPFSWMLMAFFAYGTNQHYLQRVFAAKDPKTASFSFYFTGATYLVYGLVVGVIGLTMVVLLPNMSDANAGFATMIRDLLPTGIRGLALGGLLAATLSTADSVLLSASSIFINDLYEPCSKKEHSEKHLLIVTRVSTIIISFAGFVCTLLFQRVTDIVYTSTLLYGAVVFFPLILGVMGVKIHRKAAEIALPVAFVVGCVSEFYLTRNFEGVLGLPSNFMASGIGLIVVLLCSFYFNKRDKNTLLSA